MTMATMMVADIDDNEVDGNGATGTMMAMARWVTMVTMMTMATKMARWEAA